MTKTEVKDSDFHPHIRARMMQRGITKEEVARTVNEGVEASSVKYGVLGKVMVFPFQAKWEGRFYEDKEVTVYYKLTKDGLVLLTAKARYGKF